ncbi:hypothetical protein HZ326_24510 [Fusarium oxysporum f. sp. albedinis]|nr:Uncharacterized protein HZ326_25638 [Fusarium oxysporum f. sp. albedinis]KAJ0132423.1 hypothetical protein HZ326_24510 [Fusarium oxysporum f. sp. albedinis]
MCCAQTRLSYAAVDNSLRVRDVNALPTRVIIRNWPTGRPSPPVAKHFGSNEPVNSSLRPTTAVVLVPAAKLVSNLWPSP